MFKKHFTIISLHYLAWFFGITLIFLLQLVLSLKESGFQQPVQASLYLKYLVLNLAWIASLSLPLSGLMSSSSAYVSGLLIQEAQQASNNDNPSLFRLAVFLGPAAALGSCVALISLVICLFIVPPSNLQIGSLMYLMKSGTVASNNPVSDRAMSVGQLLRQAKQISNESRQLSEQQKSDLNRKQNQLMIEVYKKFAIPLLGFLLPILGSLMALILSKRKTGGRIILFLFDIFVLIFIWILLIAGEAWGDRGILHPFVSMFLTPALAIIIIAALLKRSSEVFAPLKAAQ